MVEKEYPQFFTPFICSLHHLHNIKYTKNKLKNILMSHIFSNQKCFIHNIEIIDNTRVFSINLNIDFI